MALEELIHLEAVKVVKVEDGGMLFFVVFVQGALFVLDVYDM